MTNKKNRDAKNLAKVWSDGSLLNQKAIDENYELIAEILKGTIYEIKDGE